MSGPLAGMGFREGDVITVRAHGHYDVVRPRLPPLPTEEYTVIEVVFEDRADQALTRSDEGTWYNRRVSFTDDELIEQAERFIVRSRPVDKVLAEDEDAYFDSDDIATARSAGHADVAAFLRSSFRPAAAEEVRERFRVPE